MSDTIKKLLSALVAALIATAISFAAKSFVPLAPAAMQPVLTAVLVAIAHYVDAWQGAATALKKAGPVAALLLGLCFAHNLNACSLFSAKAPSLEQCAPTPAALATQVADILTAGGDYKSALEALAAQDTEAAVICAVQAFVDSQKIGSSGGNAQSRGRAYLASKGIK